MKGDRRAVDQGEKAQGLGDVEVGKAEVRMYCMNEELIFKNS